MKSRYLNDISKDESGAVAIITAVVLVFVLLGIAALAIDIGRLAATKNELQNASDAAALAGTGELARQYINNEDQNEDSVREIVREVAKENRADGDAINIPDDDDILIGYWTDQEGFTMNSSGNLPGKNSVKVITRRSGVNQITTFFARVFGFDSVSVNATATAALTGGATIKVSDGEVELPFGLNTRWFGENEDCWRDPDPDDEDCRITFHPASSSAGWHVFELWPVRTPTLWEILDDVENKNMDPYEYDGTAGDTYFNFTGGTLGEAGWGPLQDAFMARSHLVDENDPESLRIWETSIVVYEDTKLNPTGPLLIVGVVNIVIRGVYTPPYMEIWANVEPFDDGKRGEGGTYGTLGTIPNLVE